MATQAARVIARPKAVSPFKIIAFSLPSLHGLPSPRRAHRIPDEAAAGLCLRRTAAPDLSADAVHFGCPLAAGVIPAGVDGLNASTASRRTDQFRATGHGDEQSEQHQVQR